MKSSLKITTTLLSVILFFSIMVSGGCDEDKAWETTDSSTGQTIMTLVIVDLMKTFTVYVTVSGLTSTSLVLQNNSGDDLTINADGTYQFTTPLPRNADYNVTVLTQPTNPVSQTCSTSNGSGVNLNNDVTITFSCI